MSAHDLKSRGGSVVAIPPRGARPGSRAARARGWLANLWEQRDWAFWLLLASALHAAAFVIWLAFGWGGEENKALISDIAQIPCGFAVAGLAWGAARALSGRPRRAWRLIALSYVLWGCGDALWYYYGHVLKAEQFGKLPDLFYLLYYPVLMVGLLQVPDALPGRGERAKFWLDALTVTLGSGMVVWHFILRPIALAGAPGTLETALALGYPVGDLVLLFGLVTIRLRQGKVGGAATALAAGLLLLFFADLVFGYLSLEGNFQSGGWSDLFWVYAHFMVGLSACLRRRRASRESAVGGESATPCDARRISLLPYAGVATGYGVLLFVTIQNWQQGTSDLDALILGAVALTGLVVSRQFVAVRENLKLESENAARRSEARFSSLVQNSSDLVTILDADTTIRYMSPSVRNVLGFEPEQWVGRRLTELLPPEEAQHVLAFFADAATRPGATSPVEWRLRHADGRLLHTQNVGNNLLDDENVRGIVLNTRDVSEQHGLEEQLTHQAFHDSLTGLANRALFINRVEHALAKARRNGRPLAVLFLDLDNFKHVNDSLGHGAGDRLLCSVAARLGAALRSDDTGARLGGDEFAVLLEEINLVADAADVAARVAEALRAPFPLEGKEVFVGVSVGIAVSERGRESAGVLLRNADVAMYTAKTNGKGRCAVYEPGMDGAALRRLELEADLRHAVEREELSLRYQPIVDLGTGRIRGFEALLRWEHPQRGAVSPGSFIPLAEETGLIVPIGTWALGRACCEVARWRRRHGLDVYLTVNLSGRQLHGDGMTEEVARALGRAGLDPSSLVLEITESVMMRNTQDVLAKLDGLKRLGVRLAVDDFGTGYSSLSYLQRFPIDILKIDKSFVDDLGAGDGDRALVRAILSLGETLDLRTVAEGIEREEQRQVLLEMGCRLGQGFLFAKPLSVDEVDAFLARGGAGDGPPEQVGELTATVS